MLETVASALLRVPGQVRTLRVIRSRMPLVMLTDAASGVACDISFIQPNGPTNVPVIRRYPHSYPALHPLLLVVKAFLQQRGLNEVFTGGLGSTRCCCWWCPTWRRCVSISPPARRTWAAPLQPHPLRPPLQRGVCVDRGWRQPHTSYRVKSRRWAPADGDTRRYSVKDPNDEGNELGRDSYAAAQIRKVFAVAAAALGNWRRTGATVEHPTPLTTILYADPQMVTRREVVRRDQE
ncbi:hypothetical protein BU14_0582s0010 [Porphyra umbilicalis]|uniref:Uncharacterized protein n=1 Tax=Porphyra umbilicalis TaxID=2786 RepID=A0A1X6NRE2_PORUM|nr:hypothetical protein BU14_0582s0010 [Porphyra umbilicalis]|eukprot:OSX71174.1 hypothetical protein BU14_0582s0010 [Porphyra umbilicalis]